MAAQAQIILKVATSKTFWRVAGAGVFVVCMGVFGIFSTVANAYQKQSADKNKSKTATVNGTFAPGSMDAPVDDYPFRQECLDHDGDWHEEDGIYSPFRYAYCNCTDFAAWRVNRDAGVTHPDENGNWKYNWGNLVGNDGDGDAGRWINAWIDKGWPVYDEPQPGFLFVMPNNSRAGHIGYVQKVNSDGSIVVEDENWVHHRYDTRTVTLAERTGGGRWAGAKFLPMPYKLSQ